jgi:arginase
MQQRLTFIGAPADSVKGGSGAGLAPATLRELGIVAALGAVEGGDLDVAIRGVERDPRSGLLAAGDVLAATATIRGAVAARVAAGERPFLCGGCCSVLPGALAGARDAVGPLALVHFDGHLDLYDGETSVSGEAADMPVSVALGLGPAAWVAAVGGPGVAAERAALVGFRDRAESLEYGMRQPETIVPAPLLRPADDLHRRGGAAVAAEVEAALGDEAPIWLHFDVDVLDRDVFAATDYLMPGGLDWDEASAVLAVLLASPRLLGVSLGCYNPNLDPDRACGRALVEALAAAA